MINIKQMTNKMETGIRGTPKCMGDSLPAYRNYPLSCFQMEEAQIEQGYEMIKPSIVEIRPSLGNDLNARHKVARYKDTDTSKC